MIFFDPSGFSDQEIETKIEDLQKKIDLVPNNDWYNQMMNMLTLLYEEQDERYEKSLMDVKDGVVLDTELDFSERTTNTPTEKTKDKEKAKSFLDKMPEMKKRWNEKTKKE